MAKKTRYKLLIESAEHWERDIIKPLEEGRVATSDKEGGVLWEDNTLAPSYSLSCPLCVYLDFRCKRCPLSKHDNGCWDDSTWMTFDDNPTLENARAMAKKLREIAELYKPKKSNKKRGSDK